MRKVIHILSLTVVLLFAHCTKRNEECEAKCKQVGDAGPCLAAFKRYYFDATERKCKEFTWGGCNGVVPFETLEECQSCGCK
ncbi:MAG: BPTI/Kunitz domain-containing protein [Saprospiraceae bacterium]|nr:BPTI/Kunitz domain-containing protein [Saprospiraceae bacterium]